MSIKLSLKNRVRKPFFGVVFGAILAILLNLGLPLLPSTLPNAMTSVSMPTVANVYAAPEYLETTDPTDPAPGTGAESTDTCYDQVGAIGWLVCPTTGVLGKAVDAIYEQIEKLLVVEPISTNSSSPVYQVWQAMRDITNIVFVIFLLIIVYSQITGLGISNYGIKRALPKLVIAAVLMNLSYLVCAVCVDVSNISGSSIKGIFTGIEQSVTLSGGLGGAAKITWTQLTGALIGGGAVAGVAVGAAGGLGAFLWSLVVALLGAILAVLVGLITLGLRQALILVLIMVAPLAFVAYMLPNTEGWFKKWKDIFVSMLVFYPLFSLLFGASQLAGWAIIANSLNGDSMFGVVLGMAVQVFPLFLSISLMKMSSTILGSISSKLNNLANRPQAGIRAFGDKQKEAARMRYIAQSHRPGAALRRYMDKRDRKRELDVENAAKTRKALAEIYAQKKIAGGNYEPAEGTKQSRLRANSSTRLARTAMNADLAAQYITKDTAHLLDQYGNYYTSALDKNLAKTAGENYKEFYRTMLAEENDAFADQDWIMGEYNKYRAAYNPAIDNIAPNKRTAAQKKAAYNYEHYVVGAAGALGKGGETTVLGEVISKSSANEAKRKAYNHYAFAKYTYGKSDARHMLAGYYVNDDGFAANKDGSDYYYEWDDSAGNHHRVKERAPGEFLKYHPEWLEPIAYDKYDEDSNGKRQYYYDAVDMEGKFVGRIYKNDGAAMKEILSNWDMTINDPVNSLYGILSGINEGDYAKYGLQGVGLAQLSTTLGRATLSANFKEKAAFAGPMYAESVQKRFIKDMVHLNIARLDNLTKTAKPSGFNTQDAAELNQLQMLMNPENWDWMLFDYESLKSFRNVNGKFMKGTRYDVNPVTGEVTETTVPHDQATLDELKNTVIKKYLLPAAPKFASMMSRMTNGIMDNQKPGAQENWAKLLDAMESWNDKKWLKKYPMLNDPFAEQRNDTISLARDVARRIRPNSFNKPSAGLRERMYNSQQRANSGMDDPNNPFNTTSDRQQANRKKNGAVDNVSHEYTDGENPPYELTEEDRQADRDFEREERNAPWSTYNRNDDEYFEDNDSPHPTKAASDHIMAIDMIAAENSNSDIFFFDAVRQYLDAQMADDPRFAEVIDAFEEYITFHKDEAYLSIEDHAREINDMILSFIQD